MTNLLRIYRIVATGFAFAVFGVGALLLAVLVFPLLSAISGRGLHTRRWILHSVHLGCAFFIGLLKTLGLISYEVRNRERLAQPGALIVANHPSLIDVVFLLAWIPELDCIVKQSLLEHPFLGRAASGAGYIGNGTVERLIRDGAGSLSSGRSLVLFPEGTRTVPGQPVEYHRGAAHIALMAQAPIVPVHIRCEPPTLMKGVAWYRVPAQRPHYTFSVLEPLSVAQFRRDGESQTPAAFRVTQHLEALLTAPWPPAAVAQPELQLVQLGKA